MKQLKHYNGVSEEKVFEGFISSLQRSITGWDYFVDWQKVQKQVERFNTELNILNSIIGSPNIESDFINLCKKYPEVKKTLTLLIAVRREKLRNLPILKDRTTLEVFEVNELFNKENNDYDNLLHFFIESGLKDLFEDKKVKNLVDYVTGVEVGMDTNGRKNRTGITMEKLVEQEVKKLCNEKCLEFGLQMTAKNIKEKWNKTIPTDKSKRRFDFAINTETKVFLIEVNFYRGGGTKLKATAGEFIELNRKFIDSKHDFIWITDGLGWLTAHIPLKDAFVKNDYIFNLKMIKEGILRELL